MGFHIFIILYTVDYISFSSIVSKEIVHNITRSSLQLGAQHWSLTADIDLEQDKITNY